MEGIMGCKEGVVERCYDVETFNLEAGIEAVMRKIQTMLGLKKNVIVSVAGGSASGKTDKVAAEIQRRFGEKALVLSLDDYYKGIIFMEAMEKKGEKLNWDQPEAVDLEMAALHIADLKRGYSVWRPTYNVKTGRRIKSEEIASQDVIIVEGNFALEDAIANQADLCVFVDIGPHGRLMRRLMRDVSRTDWNPVDILEYFADIVQPMHERYIESNKGNAHMIISNEYDPVIEAKNSGLHEVQLKFKTEKITDEHLRRLGAERIGLVQQCDSYYNPSDRNLSKTGEMIRIRVENGHHILTYKGPKCDSDFCRRAKFECEINSATARKLCAIYTKKIMEIEKERTLYQLDGIVITLDKVVKTDGGKGTNLGRFVEIRCTENQQCDNYGRIFPVIQKLGLRLEDGVKTSYVEM